MIEALYVALNSARKDARSRDAPPPPTALSPFLKFKKMPERALGVLVQVLDSDEEFRVRVLESVGDPEDLEEPSRLFLQRPTGWEQRLGEIAHEFRSNKAQGETQAALTEARRRVAALESGLERLQVEEAGLRERVEELEDALTTARSEAGALMARLDASQEEGSRLSEKLTRAIRDLNESKRLARDRLDALRELERASSSGNAETEEDRSVSAAAAAAAEAATAAVEERARELHAREQRLKRLTDEFSSALAELRGDDPRDGDGPGDSARSSGTGGAGRAAGDHGRRGVGGSGSTRNTRAQPRRALRMGRGVVDDSPEGLLALLQQPGICVLVDGYNVSKSAWPNHSIADQREQLVAFLGGVKARHGTEIHVVFDGDSSGSRPSTRAPYPVRVHFTEMGVEADDRILEFLEGLDSSRPALVVTSDERVRRGARARGANVVSSRVLLQLRR